MKKRRKKFIIKALCFYGAFMGLFMLLSIKVLGYSTPRQVFLSMYATVESIGWNLVHDFDPSAEIKQLPESIKDSIPFDEWSIVQTKTSDVEESVFLQQKNLDHIIGLTDIDAHTIYLSSNDAEAHFAFCHEIGHVADYYHNWLSHSEEFLAIYEKEAGQYADANFHQAPHYATSSSYEFFASVFCDILLDNQENIQSVPETVQFIRKHLDL